MLEKLGCACFRQVHTPASSLPSSRGFLLSKPTGESVEENANVVVRLLIRRPECFGPALRGEGGNGLLAAIEEAIQISQDPARDGPTVKKDRRRELCVDGHVWGGGKRHKIWAGEMVGCDLSFPPTGFSETFAHTS